MANGGLAISGATVKTLGRNGGPGSSGIINNGVGTWSGANISNWASGRFTNGSTGSLDIQTDADFLAGTFINEGTLTKSVGVEDGSDKTRITAAFNNTGTVDAQQGELSFEGGFTQTAGTTMLTGGTITANTALDIQGGSLIGSGDVNADVDSAGTIAPGLSAGALTINGDMDLFVGSDLSFEIGGTAQGTAFDFIDVNGDVTLDGVLTLAFLDGFETLVSASDTFVLLTADSDITGVFTNITSGERLDTIDGFGSFIVNYGPGSLAGSDQIVLTDFVVPEPTTLSFLIIGWGWALRRRGGCPG